MRAFIAYCVFSFVLACGSTQEGPSPAPEPAEPVAEPVVEPEPSPSEPPASGDTGACVRSGCSGTVCVPEGKSVMTTCEYKPEYDCYREVPCERQADGQCGFGDRETLDACIAEARQSGGML